MIFAVIAYLQLYNVVFAYYKSKTVQSLETKIWQGKNISDDELVVDPYTFINDYGLRRRGEEKQSLRNQRTPKPSFYPPSQRQLKTKIMDLMRQSLYDTQDAIMSLDPILNKYKDDPVLRIAFLFDRLDQIVIDIRRVYTLARKWRWKKRVYEQIIWYTHCVRKFFDVQYIVEHLIDTHANYTTLIKRCLTILNNLNRLEFQLMINLLTAIRRRRPSSSQPTLEVGRRLDIASNPVTYYPESHNISTKQQGSYRGLFENEVTQYPNFKHPRTDP